MGLDMYFMKSKEKIDVEEFNDSINNCDNFDCSNELWKSLEERTSDVYYFRKNYQLHDFITNLYKKYNPTEYAKYGDNCTLIELTLSMLEEIQEWLYNNELENPENEDFDYDFYNVLCGMIYRCKHGQYHYYYEGDY